MNRKYMFGSKILSTKNHKAGENIEKYLFEI